MIDWLMQRTADGATYLQVVIIMTLWLLVIYLIYCSICDYVESDIYNDEDGDWNGQIFGFLPQGQRQGD